MHKKATTQNHAEIDVEPRNRGTLNPNPRPLQKRSDAPHAPSSAPLVASQRPPEEAFRSRPFFAAKKSTVSGAFYIVPKKVGVLVLKCVLYITGFRTLTPRPYIQV